MAALGLVGDGFLDVAVGVPREDVGAKADAGAVEVLLGFLEGSGDLGSGSFTLTRAQAPSRATCSAPRWPRESS